MSVLDTQPSAIMLVRTFPLLGHGNLAGQGAFPIAGLHLLMHGLPIPVLFLPRHTIIKVMT